MAQNLIEKIVERSLNRLCRIATTRASDKVLVLGDSHATIFNHWRMTLRHRGVRFVNACVPGATASGLENPNSKTQAGNRFKEALKTQQGYRKVIVMLGEVDTGFVIWYRAQNNKGSVEDMLSLAVDNYVKLIGDCRTHADTIVISTPLPTITDGTFIGEVSNLRREVAATQKERTQLTMEFNKRVQAACAEIGVAYLNFDAESLGAEGIVDSKLLNKNTADHHYDKALYTDMLSRKLTPLLRRNAAAAS